MVVRFSERYGYVEPRKVIQTEDLDAETRMAIWNRIAAVTEQFDDPYLTDIDETVALVLWLTLLHGARDEYRGRNVVWMSVKNIILNLEWFRTFDAIEAVVETMHGLPDIGPLRNIGNRLEAGLNDSFRRFLVGYRLVEGHVLRTDSETDIEAIATALADTSALAAPHGHLQQALKHLADRDNPDYRNVIKEAISAVESIATTITSKKTLGEAMSALGAVGVATHPALIKAWKAMYGYTSEEGGLRHGGDEIADVDQALAKYVLVTCSAMVAYLAEEGGKANKL